MINRMIIYQMNVARLYSGQKKISRETQLHLREKC
jgi:hypothetical protein